MTSKHIFLNPKKLLHSKWTAVKPVNKEKHFMVSKLILPEELTDNIEFVEIEAVYSKRKEVLPWRALTHHEVWLQGWL